MYNNSSEDTDITGTCVSYASGTAVTTGSKLYCFSTSSLEQRIFAAAGKPITLATAEFQAAHTFTGDSVFSAGLAGMSGHVYILHADNSIYDAVGWGAAVNPEGSAVLAPSSGKVLMRKQIEPTTSFQDTGNNAEDFRNDAVLQIPLSTGLYEATDFCLNNAEFPGLQNEVPEDFVRDQQGNCIPEVVEETKQLIITEMLPDAVGADTGGEFIEIYNPYDEPVGLAGYKLAVGQNFEKLVSLPSNLEISPKQYLAFYNSTLSFTLLNSSSRARLIAPDSTVVGEIPSYANPKEGHSWAQFEDGWKFTQKATPDAVNEYIWEDEESESDSGLAPCPAGKFRNPLTNRCKNIATTGNLLKPCAVDQVRNPETNRCRKIGGAGSSLTPCKPGQERNPETNRCRKIGSDTNAKKPCQPGYERNPETNRCRKVQAVNSSLGAPAAINPVSLSSRLITVLVIMAVLYALYEYRTDIGSFISRIRDKRGNPRPPG